MNYLSYPRWHVFKVCGNWFAHFIPLTGPTKRMYEGTSFEEAHATIGIRKHSEPS